MNFIALLASLALSAAPLAPPEIPKPPPGSRFAGGGNLSFEVPEVWEQKLTNSSMRRGQWILPKAKGDKVGPEAVLFYFGPGMGGGIEQNLERWFQGFDVGAGKAAKDVAKVTRVEHNGLKITRVELTGRYVAPKVPGNPEQWNEPNWQMLAAIVEHGEGPHFVRVVGPAKSVGAQKKAFDKLIDSFRLEKPESRHAVPK